MNNGDLRVYWISQVPMSPFLVPVSSVGEGKKICETLANYDLFQFENNIKPDYCNSGGIQVFEDGEWSDFIDDDDVW